MTPKINLIGQRFGRLTVIEDVGRLHREVLWRCLCDCGKDTNTIGYSLKTGRTRSCGCSYRDRNFRHGYARKGLHHPLYETWAGMIRRCTNERLRSWKDYGGRGITVCEHWRYDFAQFLADMGEKPSRDLSIDKDTPGGNGNYHCDRCGGKVRWATRQEQIANQRPHTLKERTHCAHGHPLDEANTFLRKGGRVCKTCSREHDRKRRPHKIIP